MRDNDSSFAPLLASMRLDLCWKAVVVVDCETHPSPLVLAYVCHPPLGGGKLVSESTVLPLVLGYHHMICLFGFEYGFRDRVSGKDKSQFGKGAWGYWGCRIHPLESVQYHMYGVSISVLGVAFPVSVFLCRI